MDHATINNEGRRNGKKDDERNGKEMRKGYTLTYWVYVWSR
jgi:hypothetical protein